MNSESCHTSKMELFPKIVKNEKPFTILQKPPSWMFDKVLNMVLELASKVKTNVSFFKSI